jgi:uridine kinase
MRPTVVGIAGGTGSGKSTVARAIARALPPGKVALVEMDAYYNDYASLDADARARINFDHPDALDFELLEAHVRELRAGRPIEAPLYDFKTHRRRAESRTIVGSPIVVVEGILTFVKPRIRELLDVKLFVDTDADIRLMRRIRRDMEHRGRTFESIREQYYRTVAPMHRELVEPSKRYADLILPEGGENRVGLDMIVAKLLILSGALQIEGEH